MRITAEISLYPLRENFVEEIKGFIRELREHPGLEVITNQMSTQLRGDFDAVTGAVQDGMRRCMQAQGSMVFVVKYLNADLDISGTPQI